MPLSLTNASLACGYLSIVFWLFAQIPQIIDNHRRGSVDGVSIFFLGSWIMGDVANLTGCVLTLALPFQILLSLYYCSIDVVLIGQYYYYTIMRPPRAHQHKQHSEILNMQAVNPQRLRSRSSLSSLGFVLLSTVSLAHALPLRRLSAGALVSKQTIGLLSAWLCTLLYLAARGPQLWSNHQRRSTKGLSMYLFVAALLGNVTYTVSIMSSPLAQGLNRAAFLAKETPYLLGSCGTVGFDLLMLGQWYLFDVCGRFQRPRAVVSAQRQREYSSATSNILPILINQRLLTQAKIANNTPITCMDLLDVSSTYGDRPGYVASVEDRVALFRQGSLLNNGPYNNMLSHAHYGAISPTPSYHVHALKNTPGPLFPGSLPAHVSESFYRGTTGTPSTLFGSIQPSFRAFGLWESSAIDGAGKPLSLHASRLNPQPSFASRAISS